MQTLLYPNPHLKQKTVQVTEFNEDLKKFANELFLHCLANKGLGMAAPQVGSSLSLVVVNNLLLNIGAHYPRFLVNPVIVNAAGTARHKEGCLSVPGVYAWVNRFAEFQIQYSTLEGEPQTLSIQNANVELFGIVVQHEIDHLNGIEFIEKLSPFEYNRIVDRLNKLRPRK